MFGFGTKQKTTTAIAIKDKLPRRDPMTAIEANVLDRELAEEAAKVLGYKASSAALKQIDDQFALEQLLAKLEIRPFIEEDVALYKGRMARKLSNEFSTATWKESPIQKTPFNDAFEGPIPQFAVHTALRLKKENPDCMVTVEHLVQTRTFDPFLVVRLSQAKAYVEFWDEASFTGQRKA